MVNQSSVERGFRELFENLFPPDENVYSRVIVPWLDNAFFLMDRLRKYGSDEAKAWRYKIGRDIDELILDDIWELYALSRVNDILLLSFQHGLPDRGNWVRHGPPIRLDEYEAFLVALGMNRILQDKFHPFYCEIVLVDQAPEPDEPITVAETLWPGFMLGKMMFSRAGVRVRGGINHVVKELAETSTLFWTYTRRYRPVDDLSHGWGSNSQWRTEFRRDYRGDGTYYYHVDGESTNIQDTRWTNPHAEPRLSPDELIELVTNRCFIKSPKDSGYWSPYSYSYVE